MSIRNCSNEDYFRTTVIRIKTEQIFVCICVPRLEAGSEFAILRKEKEKKTKEKEKEKEKGRKTEARGKCFFKGCFLPEKDYQS